MFTLLPPGALLALAIVFELIATASLKASNGFTRPLPSTSTVIGYAISFYLLSLTLRKMEVGTVYAIWSGAGTAAMALIGYWLFEEGLPPIKVVSIVLIVLGVVGLNLSGAREI
jgi:small multidrug resistance pump